MMPLKSAHISKVTREAQRSEHSEKHAAIMIKNGKVLGVARNQYCSSKRLSHFHSTRVWSVHAEMALASSFPKAMTKGAVVCVVRVNKQGDLVNSEPCELCKKVLVNMGVKKVFYS